MPSSVSVDGLTPAAAPQPTPPSGVPPTTATSAKKKPSAVTQWKKTFVFLLIAVTVLYALWAGFLMLLLPSPTGAFASLQGIGLLTAVAAGAFYLIVGIVGALRIKDVKTSAGAKQFAALKVAAAVLPGLFLSVAMPLAILREPAIMITIVSPSAEEMVAPVTISFSVEDGVNLLRLKGFTPIRYRWDLNADKKADQETVNPTLNATFDREGVYTVSVSMASTTGETRVASRRFVIQKSVFSVAPMPPIVEKPVVFSIAHLVDTTNPVTDVQWDFDGDGKVDEVTKELESTFTFYRLGRTTVSAVVGLTNKTQVRYERTIDVQNQPELPFPVTLETEPSHLISPPPFPALFRIESTEAIAQVQWNFGDGTKGEGVRVAHTFDRKGSFPVTAKVWTQSGETADLSTVVRVVDTLQLTDLAFDGTPAVVGNKIAGEVPVTLSLKPRTNVPFVTFFWEAPNATEVGSTDTTLQAIYRREGIYTVTLVAQDSEDRVLRLPISVEVKPPSSSLNILLNPESGVAPLEVQFDASETFIPGETITGFEWTFGDRTETEFGGARAKHVYQNAGTYEVSLTVRTTSGKELRTDKTIVVRAPVLSACIEPSRIAGTAPLGVEFSLNCSTGDIAGVLWDFGDNAQTDEASPVHVFETPGSYKVTLAVTDSAGRQAKTSVLITVRP